VDKGSGHCGDFIATRNVDVTNIVLLTAYINAIWLGIPFLIEIERNFRRTLTFVNVVRRVVEENFQNIKYQS